MTMIPGGRSSAVVDAERAMIDKALAGADAGRPRDWVRICQRAWQGEAMLAALINARAYNATAKPLPARQHPLERAIVEEWRGRDKLHHFLATEAPAIGWALVEIVWRQGWLRVEGRRFEGLLVMEFNAVDPAHVTFAVDTDEPMLTFDADPVALLEDKFVMVRAHGVGIAAKRGFMRQAIDPVIARRRALARAIDEGRQPSDRECAAVAKADAELLAIVTADAEGDGVLLQHFEEQVVAAFRRMNTVSIARWEQG